MSRCYVYDIAQASCLHRTGNLEHNFVLCLVDKQNLWCKEICKVRVDRYSKNSDI